VLGDVVVVVQGVQNWSLEENMSGRQVLMVFIAIAAVSVALFGIIFIAADATLRTDLLKEAASTLLQLALIGILGAFAKYLLDRYSADRQRRLDQSEREQEQREIEHKAQINALNSLTTSYWQIKKALHIIDAHRSAKSYGAQVRQIIDYRLELQRLNNEIQAGLYALDDVDTIKSNLDAMDNRLEDVIDEWKANYLELAQLQNRDEKRRRSRKKVPDKIGDLAALKKMRGDGDFKAIHVPFQNAVTPIRDRLKEDLQTKSTSG
jgi:hypothetical protein